MLLKMKRVFSILILIVFIGSICIRIIAKSENIATYHLYRAIAWSKFIKNTENMNTESFSLGIIYSKDKIGNKYTKMIEESMHKSNVDILKVFGQTNSYPFRIVVYPTSNEYKKVFGASDYSVALYDTYALYFSMDSLTVLT